MAVIGGFRSDMSITRMIDGNFWKRFRECFVFQSRVSTKTVVTTLKTVLKRAASKPQGSFLLLSGEVLNSNVNKDCFSQAIKKPLSFHT